jgi:hypothetical protein
VLLHVECSVHARLVIFPNRDAGLETPGGRRGDRECTVA